MVSRTGQGWHMQSKSLNPHDSDCLLRYLIGYHILANADWVRDGKGKSLSLEHPKSFLLLLLIWAELYSQAL